MMLRFAHLALFLSVALGFQGVCWAQIPGQMDAPPPPVTDVNSLEDSSLPGFIVQQRQALALQREAIHRADEQKQAACWQKLSVNACLIEARRLRRQALDPLTQQELVLNAQERMWKTEQREKRLQGKQPSSGDRP